MNLTEYFCISQQKLTLRTIPNQQEVVIKKNEYYKQPLSI